MKSPPTLRDRLGYLRQRMLYQKEFGEHCMKTELRRCLSTPQLTLLGVGNTIGVGIYVMLGVMAKENAGPSVVLSFVAAIFVTMMNALVFAEFATVVPQTGACYIYIYKVLGEFVGFLVGWVMLIMFALSSSVGARAWSGMVDSFFNHTIQAKTIDIFGKIQFGTPFAESLDILAFVFQISVVIIISCNVFCSSIINTILSIITSSVLVFVFIAGLVYGDVKNFTNVDHGGFFPFGVAGVIKGASLAIYATSGFEIVSLSAEETKDPAKSVPRAIILELLIVGVVYIGAAIGMLYLIPYWLIDLRAPLPSAFEYNGVIWGKVIVTFGPLFGITNLQMLGLYSLSRIIYRMAKDGLFFQWFLKVNKRTGIPLNSVVFVGIMTSISALLFDLSYIVKVTVLLMLLNYMIVGSALIKLKITEFSKRKASWGIEKQVANELRPKHVHNFYDHEVVVSEYETCESAESPEAEAGALDSNVSADVNFLVDFNNDLDKEAAAEDGTCVPKQETSEKLDATDKSQNNSCGSPPDVRISGISEDLHNERNNVNKNISCDDDESDEQQTLFHKTSNSSNKKNNTSELSSDKRGHSSTVTNCPFNNSCNEKIARLVSPLVPGVLSVNTILVFHWICCMTISYQVNFGWQDLVMLKPIPVLAVVIIACLLAVFSFILWTQCGPATAAGFETPLMPLVPTISILSSSALLLSAGEMVGFIEVIVLVFAGAVVYIVMVLVSYESEPHQHDSEDTEQRKALVGGSGDDADDEVDSEDEI